MSSSAIFGNAKSNKRFGFFSKKKNSSNFDGSLTEDSGWGLGGLGGLPGGFSAGFGSNLLRAPGFHGNAATSLRSLLYTSEVVYLN